MVASFAPFLRFFFSRRCVPKAGCFDRDGHVMNVSKNPRGVFPLEIPIPLFTVLFL